MRGSKGRERDEIETEERGEKGLNGSAMPELAVKGLVFHSVIPSPSQPFSLHGCGVSPLLHSAPQLA